MRRGWIVAAAIASACAAPAPTRDVVVVASGADLESGNPLVTVHPLARQVQRYALFVTLARYDSMLDASPYFARSWDWSPDRRRLTLHLWPSLRWHDGVPTSAHDVAFTIDAARDARTGFLRRADLASVDAIQVLNDSTVTLNFAAPQPRFPLVLCELPIAPRHLLGAVPREQLRTHAFARTPVGNGPFRFVERRPREAWTFEAVPDFPQALGGPPRMNRLVIAVVDEATTKFAGLASGDLDVAGISPAMAGLVERDPSLQLVTYPVAFTTAMVLNSARPPFDDVRVRRAVAGALNRARLIDVALSGYAEPANSPIPNGHPAASTGKRAPVPVDSLLDAAGWRRATPEGPRTRDGTTLRFTLRSVGSGDNAIEQLIQADLRGHGVTVDLQQVELGTFLRDARAEPKAFDAILTGIPGDVSLTHLAAMFDGAQHGGALDYAAFHRPRLDSLFARGRRATSPQEFASAWREVTQFLDAEMPVVWVYHSRGVQGLRRRLQGVQMDLRGELVSLTRWHVDSLQ